MALTQQPHPGNPQSWERVQHHLRAAGFRYGDGLDIAYAVICAESSKDAGITGPVNADGTIGNYNSGGNLTSVDRGLTQLNSVYQARFPDSVAYDPAGACKAMRTIYLEQDKKFTAWSAYTNGAWKRFLAEAQDARRVYDQAVQAGLE